MAYIWFVGSWLRKNLQLETRSTSSNPSITMWRQKIRLQLASFLSICFTFQNCNDFNIAPKMTTYRVCAQFLLLFTNLIYNLILTSI